MTLKALIEMIAKFDNDNFGLRSSKTDPAAGLAKVMYDLKGKNTEELENALQNIKDVQSRDFINNLIDRGLANRYVFYQDPTIEFKFDLFNPYISPEKRDYSQKWHIMVSLLALLDVANHDKNFTKNTFKVKGNIENIEFDEHSLTIVGEKGSFTYKAKWAEWLYRASQKFAMI